MRIDDGEKRLKEDKGWQAEAGGGKRIVNRSQKRTEDGEQRPEDGKQWLKEDKGW